MFKWLRRLFGPAAVAQKHPESATDARVPTFGGFWVKTDGIEIAQGDLLAACFVPNFPANFGSSEENNEVQISTADLIVVTQSCDLENRKVAFVALCPTYSVTAFEGVNPGFKKKGEWEQVRQGRREGLYLVPSPEHPENNREALVVDLRQIISLPIGYVLAHAESIGPRWRLQSPYPADTWRVARRGSRRADQSPLYSPLEASAYGGLRIMDFRCGAGAGMDARCIHGLLHQQSPAIDR